MTARDGGMSRIEATGCEVRISPPSDCKYAARARMIDSDPPLASGQPTACALTAMTSPNDAEPPCPSGTKECAAQPAKSAGRIALESRRHRFGRADRVRAEARHEQRVPRDDAYGAEDFVEQRVRGLGQRAEELAVGVAVDVQARRGGVDGAVDDRGGAVVERMGDLVRRLDEGESVLVQRQGAEERRGLRGRMDCRADVVAESGEGQLLRPRAAADGFIRLQDENGEPFPGESDGGREAVRAGTDHDGIVGLRHGAG